MFPQGHLLCNPEAPVDSWNQRRQSFTTCRPNVNVNLNCLLLFSPPDVGHELFQVIQCWFLLQELLVKGNGELQLYYGEIVDGQAADHTDEVEQVKLLKGLQATVARQPDNI